MPISCAMCSTVVISRRMYAWVYYFLTIWFLSSSCIVLFLHFFYYLKTAWVYVGMIVSLISVSEGRWERWGRWLRWSNRSLGFILSVPKTHSSIVYTMNLFISQKSQHSQVSSAWQKSHGMNPHSSFVAVLLLIYFL